MEATSELALRVIESMAISPQSLRPEDEQDLALMLEQTSQRYPHQDLSTALEGYYQDYMVLVGRYGIEAVRQALQELRVMPGRKFFPQPSECAEVAEVIVKQQAAEQKQANRFEPCNRDGCMDGMRRIQRETSVYGGKQAVWVMTDCSCLRAWREGQRTSVPDRKVMAANER